MLELLQFEDPQRELCVFLILRSECLLQSFDFVRLHGDSVLVFELNLLDFTHGNESLMQRRILPFQSLLLTSEPLDRLLQFRELSLRTCEFIQLSLQGELLLRHQRDCLRVAFALLLQEKNARLVFLLLSLEIARFRETRAQLRVLLDEFPDIVFR